MTKCLNRKSGRTHPFEIKKRRDTGSALKSTQSDQIETTCQLLVYKYKKITNTF